MTKYKYKCNVCGDVVSSKEAIPKRHGILAVYLGKGAIERLCLGEYHAVQES